MTNELPYTWEFQPHGRLIICGIAVEVGMFAILWDFLYPFLISRRVLIVWVATYFLTLYTTYKGIFVNVQLKNQGGSDPDSSWEVVSAMDKYDDLYELIISYTEGKTGARRETQVKKSVWDFINETGQIC